MPCETRTINGREWLSQVRQCPITRSEFTAVWEAPIAAELIEEETIGTEVRVKLRQHIVDTGRSFLSSPAEAWRDLQARMRNAAPVKPWPEPPITAEILKLESQGFPLIAGWLEQEMKAAQAAPEASVVPVGSGSYPTVECSRKIATELRLDALPYIRRHAAGETVASFDSLTEDQLFCPWICDQGVQNIIALVAGDGLIISRFDVSAETGKPGSWLQVVTLLSGDRLPPSTICFCNRDT